MTRPETSRRNQTCTQPRPATADHQPESSLAWRGGDLPATEGLDQDRPLRDVARDLDRGDRAAYGSGQSRDEPIIANVSVVRSTGSAPRSLCIRFSSRLSPAPLGDENQRGAPDSRRRSQWPAPAGSGSPDPTVSRNPVESENLPSRGCQGMLSVRNPWGSVPSALVRAKAIWANAAAGACGLLHL